MCGHILECTLIKINKYFEKIKQKFGNQFELVTVITREKQYFVTDVGQFEFMRF